METEMSDQFEPKVTDRRIENRRARSRSRSFKIAKIMFDDDKSIYDAILKNISAYGATLNVSSTERLPDSFKLMIVQDNLTVPCHVKWRRVDSMGVAF